MFLGHSSALFVCFLLELCELCKLDPVALSCSGDAVAILSVCCDTVALRSVKG